MRKTPKLTATKIVRLTPEDSGYQHCIVRMNNHHIDSKRRDKNRFFRRDAVMIINPENRQKVLRYAMGQAAYTGMTKEAIGIDYDAMDSLGVRYGQDVHLVIRPASRLEVYGWLSQHPDLNIRVSVKLGIAGSVLGVMGFLTGLAGFTPLFLG